MSRIRGSNFWRDRVGYVNNVLLSNEKNELTAGPGQSPDDPAFRLDAADNRRRMADGLIAEGLEPYIYGSFG